MPNDMGQVSNHQPFHQPKWDGLGKQSPATTEVPPTSAKLEDIVPPCHINHGMVSIISVLLLR